MGFFLGEDSGFVGRVGFYGEIFGLGEGNLGFMREDSSFVRKNSVLVGKIRALWGIFGLWGRFRLREGRF